MSELGILYTPENIRALAAKRKWQTRRVIVLPWPENPELQWFYDGDGPDEDGYWFELRYPGRDTVYDYCAVKPRYRVGDVLYPKMAWRIYNWNHEQGTVSIQYKDGVKQENIFIPDPDVFKKIWEECPTRWRSPLYMSKWAARPELKRRVTKSRVQRVQDISEEDAFAEGCTKLPWTADDMLFSEQFAELWNSINAKPKPVREKGVITHYVSYPWDDIHETREHRGKPWHVCGNPWVHAYSFEEI